MLPRDFSHYSPTINHFKLLNVWGEARGAKVGEKKICKAVDKSFKTLSLFPSST
jgi:hypothetical protein